MKNLFEKFSFVMEMEEELDRLCTSFFAEANNLLYTKLLKHDAKYAALVRERAERMDRFFAGRLEEEAQYAKLEAAIESPLNIANFLLGFQFGWKLHQAHKPCTAPEKEELEAPVH